MARNKRGRRSRRGSTALYQNWQFKVTRDGISTHTHDYFIEARGLKAVREHNGAACYDIPIHMATDKREWCSPTLFNEVFRAALNIHHGRIDEPMYARTLSAIRELRR